MSYRYRDIRLLHRLLGGVSLLDQDAVPGDHHRDRVLGRWWARRASVRRPAAHKIGGAIITFWNFHRDGGGDDRCALFRRRQDFTGFW